MPQISVRGAPSPELVLRIVNILHQQDVRIILLVVRITNEVCVLSADVDVEDVSRLEVLLDRMRVLVLVESVMIVESSYGQYEA